MKSLFITGATGGLGQAVVARLARDYRCIAWVRSEKSLIELRNVETVARPEDVEGPIYGIVMLAGGFTMGSGEKEFADMIDANLMSAVRAVEPLREKIEDGGRVVAITSAATLTKPGGMAAYVATKSALNAYLEALAKELQPRKITVNALLPNALDTPAMRKSMSRDHLVPLDRVADAIEFLLSEAADRITGQLIALVA